MTLQLKNSDNIVISSGSIDLPLETMVVSARYDDTTKKIILTLQNGTEVEFSVADLVSGLVDETTFNTAINTINNQLSNKVDKVPGKGLSTEDYTTEEKRKLEGLSNYDDTEVKEDIEDLQEDVSGIKEENAELKVKVQDLQNNRLTDTANGESIDVSDSADSEVVSINSKGNSKQETTEGRQIFDNTINQATGSYGISSIIDTGKRITYTGSSTDLPSTIFSFFVVKNLSNYVGKTVRAKMNFTASSTNKGRFIIGLSSSTGDNRQAISTVDVSGNTASFVVPELSEGQEYLLLWLYANVAPRNYIN